MFLSCHSCSFGWLQHSAEISLHFPLSPAVCPWHLEAGALVSSWLWGQCVKCRTWSNSLLNLVTKLIFPPGQLWSGANEDGVELSWAYLATGCTSSSHSLAIQSGQLSPASHEKATKQTYPWKGFRQLFLPQPPSLCLLRTGSLAVWQLVFHSNRTTLGLLQCKSSPYVLRPPFPPASYV